MLLNHSTTSFLFLIRLFFVRDVNEKIQICFCKKIQKDIRNALKPANSNRVIAFKAQYNVLETQSRYLF